MCITFIATNRHPKYKFVLLFNRDEFFYRETYSIGFHYNKNEEFKNLLFYPLDCISGGTFLCLNIKNGNFGCLLNNNFSYRPYNPDIKFKRAEISINFCKLDEDDKENFEKFFEELNENKMDYNGFNFLCGNMKKGNVYYFTNNEGNNKNESGKLTSPIELNTNIIGVSNSYIIDDKTFYKAKVDYGKKQFENILDTNYESEEELIHDLFKLMEDDTKMLQLTQDLELNKENLDLTKNVKLKQYACSSLFVNDKFKDFHYQYGTRHTFVITLDEGNKLKVHEHCDDMSEVKLSYNEEYCYSEKRKVLSLEKREREKMKSYEFEL